MRDADTSLTRRLQALQGLSADGREAPELDALVSLAAAVIEAPMALLSILDANRHWLKATLGMTLAETPLAASFCGHAIRGSGVFVIGDTAADGRFAADPLVTGQPNVRFYAGAPIRVDGVRVGAISVLDTRPRASLSDFQTRYLGRLAERATDFLATRRAR